MAGVAHDRVEFANQLRGLAALCVVAVHFTVVYQVMRPMVAWVVAAPPYEGPVSPVSHWMTYPWFDAGAFGVALFFLISGFVIPFSLAGTTSLRFLGARALRIYPTYWSGLALQYGVVAAAGAYWGRPIVFGWETFVWNGLLVHSLIGGPGVDFVNWTLCIEVKFYLLIGLLRPFVVSHRIWPIAVVAAAAIVFTRTATGRLPNQLVSEAMYLVFMLAGTLFHYHYRGALRTMGLVVGCLMLLGAADLCWAIGPEAAAWPNKPAANYGYALVLFGAAYAMRKCLGRSVLLDRLASISYPLYLIHSVLGFTVMSFLTLALGLPYPAAALLAFAIVCLAAAGLHLTVERASQRAGQNLAKAQSQRFDLASPSPVLHGRGPG